MKLLSLNSDYFLVLLLFCLFLLLHFLLLLGFFLSFIFRLKKKIRDFPLMSSDLWLSVHVYECNFKKLIR